MSDSELVQAILKKYSKGVFFEYSDNNSRFETPIRFFLNNNQVNSKQKRENFHQKSIESAFSHFSASPQNSKNCKTFATIYTFGKQKQDVDSNRYVNTSKNKAKEFFIEKLSHESIKISSIYRARATQTKDRVDYATEFLRARNKFLLLGNPGSGKTIFLNYCLTQLQTEANVKRTIYVRLDLTKSFWKNNSISQIVKWQLLKIVFKYYNINVKTPASNQRSKRLTEKLNSDMLFDLSYKNNSLKYIVKSNTELINDENYIERFTSLNEQCASPHNSEPFDTPDWFFRSIYDYLVIDKRCHFVILFDGLDKMGQTEIQIRNFLELYNKVKTYLSTENALPASYLCVMRPGSHSHAIVDDEFRGQFHVYFIADADVDQIIARRTKYIDQLTKSNITGKALSEFLHFAEFSTNYHLFGLTDFPPLNGNWNLRSSAQLFGSDKRKLLSALASAFEYQSDWSFDTYSDKIRDEHMRKRSYLFLESLMLGRYGNQYRIDRGVVELTERASRGLAVDQQPTFIHNILHSNIEGDYEGRDLLIGLRALKAAGRGTFSAASLATHLHNKFDYSERKVWVVLDGLIVDGLLQIDLHNPGEGNLIVSTVGAMMISFVIPTLEYLSIAMQSARVPLQLLTQGGLPVRAHDSPQFVVYNKICGVLNLCKWVETIETHERDKLAVNENESLGTWLLNSVKPAIGRVIKNAEEGGITPQLKDIADVLRIWPGSKLA
jgi:hypothetical protein